MCAGSKGKATDAGGNGRKLVEPFTVFSWNLYCIYLSTITRVPEYYYLSTMAVTLAFTIRFTTFSYFILLWAIVELLIVGL